MSADDRCFTQCKLWSPYSTCNS